VPGCVVGNANKDYYNSPISDLMNIIPLFLGLLHEDLVFLQTDRHMAKQISVFIAFFKNAPSIRWIHLAQDRAQWRAVANTAMNP
jgi:hypothetical protein